VSRLMNAGRIADLDLSVLSSYSNTNLHSALYIIQPALPYLRKAQESDGAKGRIVLTSSGASMTGYAGWGLYCMAKSGLNALARVLATEEKDKGVAVWSVRPGVINVSYAPRAEYR
jgi:NAD(P)-dependent dehydrogenase (short-subunit alcohol dehydrogenase family)